MVLHTQYNTNGDPAGAAAAAANTALLWLRQDLDNDLPGLLRVQSVNNSIALLLLDDKSTELALNTVTSLVLYGNAPNYIVAATSAAGTSACKNLRLPCYNATGLADNMDWGKIVMAAEVNSATSST